MTRSEHFMMPKSNELHNWKSEKQWNRKGKNDSASISNAQLF